MSHLHLRAVQVLRGGSLFFPTRQSPCQREIASGKNENALPRDHRDDVAMT